MQIIEVPVIVHSLSSSDNGGSSSSSTQGEFAYVKVVSKSSDGSY